MKLTSLDFRILSELMRNAKSSDRQISKKLGVSQPTVTRRRVKLERELSLRYTTIPNWEELGFEVIALTFIQWRHHDFPDDRLEESKSWCSERPNILFAAIGQGSHADRMCLSIHKTYRDYHRFLQEARHQWSKYSLNIHSFVISISKNSILRPITLETLAGYLGNSSGAL